LKTFTNQKRAISWLLRHNSGPMSLVIGGERYTYDSGTLTNAAWYSGANAGEAWRLAQPVITAEAAPVKHFSKIVSGGLPSLGKGTR